MLPALSQVMPEVQKVRWSQPVAAAPAAGPKPEPGGEGAEAATAEAAPASGKAGTRPGSSGGRKGSQAKGKQKQRRRYYDTSSESDWTDSEVSALSTHSSTAKEEAG